MGHAHDMDMSWIASRRPPRRCFRRGVGYLGRCLLARKAKRPSGISPPLGLSTMVRPDPPPMTSAGRPVNSRCFTNGGSFMRDSDIAPPPAQAGVAGKVRTTAAISPHDAWTIRRLLVGRDPDDGELAR